MDDSDREKNMVFIQCVLGRNPENIVAALQYFYTARVIENDIVYQQQIK